VIYLLPVWVFIVCFLFALAWTSQRQTRKMIRLLHELNAAGGQTLDGLSHVIHCLAYRLSPRGYVDLTAEEWKKADEGSVEVFRHADGTVRILAK
jgi:hypothetical protein